jgi:hypothetical protein
MIAEHQQHRVDWFRIIADLNMRGMSTHAICDAIDVPKATVFGWKNHDVEPRYFDGYRLILLWLNKTGFSPSQLPMEK